MEKYEITEVKIIALFDFKKLFKTSFNKEWRKGYKVYSFRNTIIFKDFYNMYIFKKLPTKVWKKTVYGIVR